ncbi:MAG TPA: hypothetical protein VFK44_06600 [Bacillales bacterium]|nr:hypothetical protein [Bacillales bacterium]
MKVEFMANDHELAQLLKQKEAALKIQSVSRPSPEAEVLIVSDLVVPYNEISEKISPLQGRIVFYLISEHIDPHLLKHVKTICDTLGIHTIHPQLTSRQIADEIQAILYPEQAKSSKTAVFFAPIPNIGTTSTALSTALAASRLTDARIGVLGLNAWDDGTDQVPYKGQSLDKLKNKLANQLLGSSEAQIFSHFYKLKKDNVYYLAGNRNIKMERLYTIEEIQYLIEICSSYFDLLILDAGSHFDNANMIQALQEADLKFLVVNQQRKALKKFEQSYHDVLYPLGHLLSDFSLVINQYADETGIPNDKDLLSELNVPFFCKIPDIDLMGLHGEAQQHILYDYGAREYMQAVDFIATALIRRTNLKLTAQEETSRAKSKWRLFTRLGAGV